MPQFFTSLPPTIFEILGVAGFGIYVLNYTLLTVHRLTSQSKAYFVLNMIAATFVLIGLTHSFNLASALIQSLWIVISIYAVVTRMRAPPVARTRPRTPATQFRFVRAD